MKWIQLDLFTGEVSVSDPPSVISKQEQITKTTRLALEVQLSFARLDTLQDTMKLISNHRPRKSLSNQNQNHPVGKQGNHEIIHSLRD